MKIIYTLISIICAIIYLFPILWIVLISLKPTDLIFSEPMSIIFPITSEHYLKVISSLFIRYLFNSLIVSVLNVVLVLTVSIPAAYAVGRLGVGRGNLLFWLLSLRMTPPIVFTIPIFIIFQILGLLDNVFVLVLVYCLFNVPLAVWVLETYIESIPTEIEEAAFIDGCNISQIWRYILIPVMAPALVTVSILMFIAAWNEYLFALILTITQSRTWTIGSQIFIGTHRVLWGELAASGILGIVPPLILITLIRSRIVEGLTLGRFKG